MQIRINGQLLLLMLTEKIIQTGGKIKQLNTDGILYLFDNQRLTELNDILKNWEKLTGLELETDEFEEFYQYAINDYLGIIKGYKNKKIQFEKGEAYNKKGQLYTSLTEIEDDYLKKKGFFIDKITLGRGMQPLIIPKAINQYLANNIPVKTTIYNSKDINDFITYQKVNKKFDIIYNDKLLTHINRYYASVNGYYLYKRELIADQYKYINMLCDSGVTVVNNFDEIKEFPNNINYQYYLKEVNSVISSFEQVQLTLF